MIPFRSIILVHIICEVFSYNLDWKHAIIYYGGSDTAFGYSFIMSGGSEPWIQIGDPLGHSYLNEDKDGVIWRCPFKDLCNEFNIFLLDPDQIYYDMESTYQFLPNMSTFLGGTMDVLQEDSIAVQSMVCAPGLKYKYETRRYPPRAIVPGACFWQEENCVNCNKIVLKPFFDPKYLYTKYSYAHGGFSTHVIKNQDSHLQVLMGAPGISYGQGGLALGLGKPVLSKPSQRRKRQNSEIVIKEYQILYENDALCYLGYQVSSGHFFTDKITYIASAPRCSYSGMVYLIKKFDENSPAPLRKKHIHSYLIGTEIGEFFGASLLVISSDNSRYDELIIGSPFYLQDTGAVYYYTSNGHSLDLVRKYVGFSNGGRFGAAMICLGKQDSNGYQDIAISAPLEDNGRGAIYLFRVGNNEFRQLQRIAGTDINSSLIGFGHSLAQADIDQNRYNDLGVGSYNGHVVILRSRPIIDLKLHLESDKEILQHNATNLIISAFVEFTSDKPPPYIIIKISIYVDEHLKRAYLNNALSSTEIIKNLTLGKKEKYDFGISIIGNENFDYIEPLHVNVHVETVENPAMMNESYTWILHNSTWGNDTFCSFCPVRAEMDAGKFVPFTLMCKDQQCKSDLSVNASFLNITSKNPLVIGSNQDLILNINISNNGEPAYLTEMIVRYKEPIKLKDNPAKCHSFATSSSPNFTAELICRIANPLWNTNKPLTIPFDSSFVKYSMIDLSFEVEVLSKSLETNPSDNLVSVNLPLAMDIELSGYATPSSMLFERHLPSIFSASFLIQNEGISSLEKAGIQIILPVEWIEPLKRKINFLKISSLKISFNDNLISKWRNCSSEIEYNTFTERKRRSIDDQNINSTIDDNLLTNRTIIMDCQNPNIVCKSIFCIIGPFASKTLIRVDVEIQMDIPIIIPILGKKDIIQFVSEARVKVEEPEKYNTLKPITETKFINMPITLTGLPPKESVETWIIALSAIGGLFILLIFSSALVKAGFFERKKKDQLKMLKQEEIELKKSQTILEEDTQEEELDQDL